MTTNYRHLKEGLEGSTFVLGIKDTDFSGTLKVKHARNHIDLMKALEPYDLLEKEAKERVMKERERLLNSGKTEEEVDGVFIRDGNQNKKIRKGLLDEIDFKEGQSLQDSANSEVEFTCKNPLKLSELLTLKDGNEREIEGTVLLVLMRVGLLVEG